MIRCWQCLPADLNFGRELLQIAVMRCESMCLNAPIHVSRAARKSRLYVGHGAK